MPDWLLLAGEWGSAAQLRNMPTRLRQLPAKLMPVLPIGQLFVAWDMRGGWHISEHYHQHNRQVPSQLPFLH